MTMKNNCHCEPVRTLVWRPEGSALGVQSPDLPKATEISIVKMNPSHVAQIAALEKQYFSAPWDERSVSSELTNDLALWLVALDGDTVAGYIGSQTVLGETDMMNVAVHPDYLRQGIGEALATELIARLKALGSHCLTLEVRASNERAQALYEKLGFVTVGRRPNYYRSPKEDALIQRKEWVI